MKAILVAALTVAHAWVDNGHMLVAEIARQDLGEGDANYVTQILQSFELDPTNDLEYDIVTAAVWPDHIKCQHDCLLKTPVDLKVFDTWHYSDVPYNPDGLDSVAYIVANATGTGDNSAVWLLGAAFETLRSSKNLLTWNFLLRFILHVAGDIHQPLHAVTGFFNNSQFGYFPNGDRGGNDIKLQGNIDELHLWWDEVAGKYPHSMPVPLTGRWKDELTNNASSLMSNYPRSYFGGLLDKNDYWRGAFHAWAEESYNFAANTSYQNIQINTMPSDSYLQDTIAVCEPRIVLGGYRVADLLRKVLEKRPALEEIQRQRKIHLAERAAAREVIANGGSVDDHVGPKVKQIRTHMEKALRGHPLDDEVVETATTQKQQQLTMQQTWWIAAIGAAVGGAMVGLVALVVYAVRSRRDTVQYVEVERNPLLDPSSV